MTDSNPADEPKIIVDDDWKSQVEKEKEALKKEALENKDEKNQPGASEDPSEQPMELPEPSFLILLSTLGSQAMACLGMLPDPVTGQPTTNLPLAKHFIDLIGMLQEKTQGNLDDEESAHLRDALHQLRMVYVSVTNSPSPATPNGDSEPASKIELP